MLRAGQPFSGIERRALPRRDRERLVVAVAAHRGRASHWSWPTEPRSPRRRASYPYGRARFARLATWTILLAYAASAIFVGPEASRDALLRPAGEFDALLLGRRWQLLGRLACEDLGPRLGPQVLRPRNRTPSRPRADSQAHPHLAARVMARPPLHQDVTTNSRRIRPMQQLGNLMRFGWCALYQPHVCQGSGSFRLPPRHRRGSGAVTT